MQRLVMPLIVIALFVGGFGTGCSPDGPEEAAGNGDVHPMQARIPHYEQAVPVTKDETLADLPDPPGALKVLAGFLDAPGAVDTTRLDVFVEEARTVDLAVPSPSRVAILDGASRLFEHDRRTGTTVLVAGKGRGPGQLRYAEAVAAQGTSVVVARQDRRIDRFACDETPCTYQQTTRLPFSPKAVTAAGQRLAVVGAPVLGRAGTKMEDWNGAIHVLGPDGSDRRSFGQTYRTDHFLVFSAYANGSSLLHSRAHDRFVRASEKLPFVWTYARHGSLETVWEVADFAPLQIDYDASERSLHHRYEDGYDLLDLQGPIDGRFVIAAVRHRSSASAAASEASSSTDYYALDLKTARSYYLGRDAPRDGGVDRLFLTAGEHHVLVEDGRVAVVQ
jgi:hypothetical protein